MTNIDLHVKDLDAKDIDVKDIDVKIKDKKINHIHNLISSLLATLGVYSALTYKRDYELIVLSLFYYLNDIQTTSLDFTIHHLLSISMSLIAFYLKLNYLPTMHFRKFLLNLELTTPGYILCIYNNNVYTQAIFALMFVYFRIYKFYEVLTSEETKNEIFNLPFYYPYISYITYSGLFGLNLYWLTIQCKKMCKPFKDSSYIFCHKIIPFIRFIFPFEIKLVNYYSALSTYLYHEDIYSAIMNNNYIENAYITPQTMVYSVVNSIVSISSIEPCYYKYSIPLHLCKYIFNLDEAIPIGLDTCFYFSTDAFVVYYIFILFRQIKPFYNLNPLAIHVLLIILRQYSRI